MSSTLVKLISTIKIFFKKKNILYNYIIKKFIKINKKLFKFIYYNIYIILILIILILLLLYLYNNIIFYKILYKYIILVLIFYLLISTFLFLNKNALFGKYTTQLQRFWKRSYSLF